mmetsp:Transcript_15654/g.15783  ORF Transcript_15654/g.15783 Transcript_15654/m.15783 type:complete len:98 (-) Transcript_15654:324-617(-)
MFSYLLIIKIILCTMQYHFITLSDTVHILSYFINNTHIQQVTYIFIILKLLLLYFSITLSLSLSFSLSYSLSLSPSLPLSLPLSLSLTPYTGLFLTR